MKSHHLASLLLILNFATLLLMSARPSESETFEKITVKEFELVGNDGERRANIKVEDDGTVMFRLMDNAGTIRVKLGANRDGSGLVLLDDATEPAIHALAKKKTGKITITDNKGKRDL